MEKVLLIGILKEIVVYKENRLNSYKRANFVSEFRHNVHNKGKNLVDFITDYNPDDCCNLSRKDWEEQHIRALKANYKWVEFPYISIVVATKYARNNGITGLVVAKDGYKIILPKGCGQARMISNIGASIKAGFKAHNAGSKAKEKMMKGRNRTENWRADIKKWGAVSIIK